MSTSAVPPIGPRAYDYLDLTGVPLDNVLTLTSGIAAADAAAQLGYPYRAVTALVGSARVYVVQLDGDRDAGTVTLAGGADGTVPVTVALPGEFLQRVTPFGRLSDLLTAVAADDPRRSLTSAFAEALAAVADLWHRARAHHRPTVPVGAIDEALACLRPILDDKAAACQHVHSVEEPILAWCARMYAADGYQRYAFVFKLERTNSRFTVYTRAADRYTIGATYTLTLTPVTEAGERGLPADAGEEVGA